MGFFSSLFDDGGGSTETTSTNTQANRTASGEGVVTGDNSTVLVERADANALIATADALFGISEGAFDAAESVAADNAILGIKFADTALSLGDKANAQASAAIAAAKDREVAADGTVRNAINALQETKAGDSAIIASTVEKVALYGAIALGVLALAYAVKSYRKTK